MSEINVIKRLLINMHCCRCKNEFSENSIKIMRNEKGLLVFQIKCEKCKKCFGMATLGLGAEELAQSFEMKDKADTSELSPISYDDVLDAHIFFQNMDENWSEYIKRRPTA